MAEQQEPIFDPFGDFFSSLWAILPEATADDLAKFKKDVLTGIKTVVNTLIDDEIVCMERHVANARKIREEDDRAYGATDTPPADATPNPA
jgi:hypothetical protein